MWYAGFVLASEHWGGGGGEGFTRHSSPVHYFVFQVGGWLACTNSTLLGQGSVHSGSASWDDCGQARVKFYGNLIIDWCEWQLQELNNNDNNENLWSTNPVKNCAKHCTVILYSFKAIIIIWISVLEQTDLLGFPYCFCHTCFCSAQRQICTAVQHLFCWKQVFE